MTIAAGISFGLSFLQFVKAINKSEPYQILEFRLSTKTKTIDNQIDTIYVITKIK